MDYEKPEPIFRTATARKEYVLAVSETFDRATSQSELLEAYTHHWARLARMSGSESEHDQLAAEIIEGRFRLSKVRIENADDWVAQRSRELEESFTKM